MKKVPGFTLEKHRQLAVDLQNMRDRFVQIEVSLCLAYPEGVCEIANDCWKQIDRLRCYLDDLLLQETDALEEALQVYFCGTGEESDPVCRETQSS